MRYFRIIRQDVEHQLQLTDWAPSDWSVGRVIYVTTVFSNID